VTVTVTPETTAPLGSMTLPEMEPVMPARATIALHRTTATAPNFRTDPVRQVTVEAPCHEK